jgi:maltose alpha-D-glucosyltransferase/alpha-amylase
VGSKPKNHVLDDNPQWYKDAVIYELHIRAFNDSNADGIGDFNGLIERLDYLQDLGVTAIWLLPFYPSPLRDGGYDIADYTDINPSYGTRRDFERLLREAHQRGLRVITELVLNHTSSEHPWFQRARTSPRGSKWRDFYVWSDTPQPYKETRIIFKDFETSNWSWDPVAKAYYWHRFYSHQPDLNFDNPHVHAALFKVVDFWLSMGVDGLRLDAVPYLYEREGTNCENLPETHQFLKKLRAHVDLHHKDKMLLAEANQWPAAAAEYFGQGDECHMNFHFPLMPRMFMALHVEDSFPIVNILHQTPPLPAGCQWAIFLRNHDELTLEMVTEEDRDSMYQAYAREQQARVNLGIRRRLAPLLKLRRRIELMNALLFSLPGTPVLYYGDEIGMGDNIYLGDRDGVRTPMQWSADRNAGFSRCNPQKLFLPVTIDPEYHYEVTNVEAQQSNPTSLLWWMKRIINLRKQHQVFGYGDIEFLHPENNKVLAFVRSYQEQRVLVVANLSRFVQTVELDLSRFSGVVPVELFGGARFPEIGRRPYFLSMGPNDFYWLSLDVSSAPTHPDKLPDVKVDGSWRNLLEKEEGHKLMGSLLASYIPARRWFRGKALDRSSISVVDVLPIKSEGSNGAPPEYFIVLAQVQYSQGASELYSIPVGFASRELIPRLTSRSPGALIATVFRKGAPEEPMGVLYDAAVEGDFALQLMSMIRGGHTSSMDGSQLVATSYRGLRSLPADTPMQARLLDAEQSNTCIIYGDHLILKLFRRVEEGINPELELGRFLSKVGFTGAPELAGSLECKPRGQKSLTLGTLQPLIRNQGDAWRLTLEALERFFELVLSGDAANAPPLPQGDWVEQASATPPPLLQELTGIHLSQMRLMGRRLASLHLVLGQPSKDTAFGREVFTTMYQQSLYQSVREAQARTMRLLTRRHEHIPESLRERAAALNSRDAEIEALLRRLTEHSIHVARIRCHGDLHLGQVLATGDDFVIIDFEGEVTRPITERRFRRCALRDVAGMLRSFHYASSALWKGRTRSADVHTLERWTNAWLAWTRASFLNGYLSEIAKDENKVAPLLPTSPKDISLLLDFYYLEKCIYEIGYELNNRPDWLEIPLYGLEDILSGGKTQIPKDNAP